MSSINTITLNRTMHRNSHYSHLPSSWKPNSTNYYEDFIPFTPCLTPASSESSSLSSPMLSERDFAIKQEPQPQLPLTPTSKPRITGVGSRSTINRANWSASPVFQSTMSFSSQGNSPSSYYTSSSSQSPPYSGSTYDTPGSNNLPPKKSRRVSSQTPSASRYPNSSHHDATRVLNIPPATPRDMTYDPSSQGYRGGYPSEHSGPSRNNKGKTSMDHQSQSQPRKYRFVSVQSAETHQGYGASGPGTKDDSRVYLEEHMEDEPEDGPFEHGPSEYPPRPYAGGEYAASPLRPKRTTGKIPASNLEFLPVLEARFDRLENAIQKYVEYRGQQALENSVLPHESQSTSKHRK